MEAILKENITNLSSSDNWNKVQDEWDLLDITFKKDDGFNCACGHKNIHKICLIGNRITKKRAIVGSSCVNNFIGLPTISIFNSMDRVANKVCDTYNKDSIDYALSRKWINEWESVFYKSIGRKINLSSKQYLIKMKINSKISYHSKWRIK